MSPEVNECKPLPERGPILSAAAITASVAFVYQRKLNLKAAVESNSSCYSFKH
jgi:hypothetical protein